MSISAGLPNWELFLRRIAACSGVKWVWDGIPSDEAQFQLVEAVGRDRAVSLMMSVLTPDFPPSSPTTGEVLQSTALVPKSNVIEGAGKAGGCLR